jgi:Na+/proline symporter
MLGAAVRLFLVCLTLQLLVFEPFGLPFILNVAITVALVWLYTFRGGVKSLIWTDSLKTFCLVVSVVLCICYIASDLNLSFTGMLGTIADSDMSRIFFFDDVNSKQYFFKQFFAGAFTMIAMTGLDQDMMQRNLSCKNFKDSQKNMITSVISQFFVILLFLMLGVLLYIFAGSQGIQVEKSDELFPLIATGNYFPAVVGILFIIGLISSAYSASLRRELWHSSDSLSMPSSTEHHLTLVWLSDSTASSLSWQVSTQSVTASHSRRITVDAT